MNRYNWDNINVGRFDLNHSENFFAFKHSQHEKLSLGAELETMIDEEDTTEIQSEVLTEQLSQDPLDCNKENICFTTKSNEIKKRTKEPTTNLEIINKPFNNLLKEPLKSSANILVKTKKTLNVLKYTEIYEKKKQDLLKKQIEDDKKNRIFHSKPAPKFNVSHEILKKHKGEIKVITAPITPRVLKNSAKAIERAKKLEDLKKKSPPKYHAKEAKVLNESPFIPKKGVRVLNIQPFNLHVEKRLGERKNFDEKIHKQMEEKRKKEEEERIRKEEELSKEFRKMTTFKARSNPFKKS